jgi:hypothetical protein
MAQSMSVLMDGNQIACDGSKIAQTDASGSIRPAETIPGLRQPVASKPREACGPRRGGFGDRSGR